MNNIKQELLSNFKFYSGNYSKYREEEQRYETWEESVTQRVMGMHREKYKDKIEANPELKELIDFAEQAYLDKLVLGSQRALQFGGAPILKHHSKMYNCLTSYADRLEFFNECMYWLLSGCGVGFRVFESDLAKLPKFSTFKTGSTTYVIEDSIEGWSDAIGVLINSYVSVKAKATMPEYVGKDVKFDYSKIRPEGSHISGGFKAPGPEGLRNAINKVETLIVDRLNTYQELRTIDVYDIVMHMSDAVLSGGVRRSATICLFHKDDDLMLNAKTGNWFTENPQRARSNNSVMLLRDEVTKDEFMDIIESVKSWGEPGFVWTYDYDIIYNPCVEIGMYPKTESGKTGWQGCNLTEINGAKCVDEQTFYRACEASAILGTLQAGYTDFKYVGPESKEIFDREALLGCSITGFANNPNVLFDPMVQQKGAEIVKTVNKKVAKMIGINQAARTTCVKPSGNASVLLGTASGIHGEHSRRYFRNVQVNKNEDIPSKLRELNPHMFEESVWSANNTDWVASFPVETTEDSMFKESLIGVNQLKLVKNTQRNWVEYGTNEHLCVNDLARHNVSNTVQVDNWDNVAEYIYNNRQYFAGVSLLSSQGDKDYPQAPFTAVYTPEEITANYGPGSIFASGLIVDGLHAFGNNLWDACSAALNPEMYLADDTTPNYALRKDWVRRFRKFASNYMKGDNTKTSYLLKDVYNYHKWEKITRNLRNLNWEDLKLVPTYTDINTMGSAACAGGSCEIGF